MEKERRKEGERERGRGGRVRFGLPMFWVSLSHKSRNSIEGFGGVESGLGLG